MKTKKINIMKPAICLAIAFLTVSCLNNKNEFYQRFSGQVEILRSNIADTVTNNSYTRIEATAQAYNGCWSNLNFILTKTSTFEYTLNAYGVYESTGSCPNVMVYKDTSIVFQPTTAGLYRFTIAKGENDTQIDTMIVKEALPARK